MSFALPVQDVLFRFECIVTPVLPKEKFKKKQATWSAGKNNQFRTLLTSVREISVERTLIKPKKIYHVPVKACCSSSGWHWNGTCTIVCCWCVWMFFASGAEYVSQRCVAFVPASCVFISGISYWTGNRGEALVNWTEPTPPPPPYPDPILLKDGLSELALITCCAELKNRFCVYRCKLLL